MSKDKVPNTCGCRGRRWGWWGNVYGWIAGRLKGVYECYGDMHDNQAKCLNVFRRMCVCLKHENLRGRTMWISKCETCVNMCVFSTSLPFHTVQVCFGSYCHPTGLIGPSSPCQLPALWCLGSLSPFFCVSQHSSSAHTRARTKTHLHIRTQT